MKTCEHALSLVLCAAIALGVGACAARGRASSTAEAPAAAADESLARSRAQLHEARAAWERGDHAAARAKAREAIDDELSEDEPGDDPERIAILSGLGDLAQDAGDLKAAERADRRVLEFRTRTLPDDHPELQRTRGNLASTMAMLGDLEGARALQEHVIDVYSRTLPEEHPDLLAARGNLARMMASLGDLAGARALQERLLEVCSRTLPDDHPQLQIERTNLASTLQALGDLEGARALQEKVLEVRMRSLPDDHPSLQAVRGNLAVTIKRLGDWSGARALEEKVLEVRTRTLPEEHPDLQWARGNLARTLYALGEFARARELEERVLDVRTRTLPDDHLDLQRARGNLALTIQALGDLSGARALQEKVLEVFSRRLPEDHPDLQLARGSLAATIRALGDPDGARALFEQVLQVLSRTLPEEHPDLQTARQNLAATMASLGDFAGARALQEQVLEVRTRTWPEEHPEVQRARGNMAATLSAIGDLAGARALEERVLEIQERTLPEGHRELESARVNLAVTIATENALSGGREGGRERCAHLVHSVAESAVRVAYAATQSSSSREAEERCSRLGWALSVSLSFAAGYGVFDPDPALGRDAFVLSEATRASALASAHLARLARSDERYGDLRKEVRAAGVELVLLAQSGATRDAFDAVIARRDRAQRELVKLASQSPSAAGLLTQPDPAALSERLSETEAIIAYRRHERLEIPAGRTEVRSTEWLCAFVLRGGAELERIDLGPMEPITGAVREWRDALGVGEGRGVGVVAHFAPTRDARPSAERIRERIFDPLVPSLPGVRRLALVLDDVLQAVPIDALPAGELLLGDRYEIEMHSTTQELSATSDPPRGEALVVLVGGADYSVQPPDTGEPRGAVVPNLLRGGAWGAGFPPLPATMAEARDLEELAKRVGGAREVVRLAEDRASRASIEELAPKAHFLHLATHGWFAPESIRSWSDPEPVDKQGNVIERTSAEERVKGESPMLLCGLALAGANLPADAVGRYPGLVTAEEISGWDLSNCELAVLSACDTNVGLRRAGQGVASLQKALQMAGARSVITSLWKVPDEATKELMLDFYRRLWVEGKPKAQALWEAKKKLREAVDGRGQPVYSTRDWAAWVLTGEPD